MIAMLETCKKQRTWYMHFLQKLHILHANLRSIFSNRKPQLKNIDKIFLMQDLDQGTFCMKGHYLAGLFFFFFFFF